MKITLSFFIAITLICAIAIPLHAFDGFGYLWILVVTFIAVPIGGVAAKSLTGINPFKSADVPGPSAYEDSRSFLRIFSVVAFFAPIVVWGSWLFLISNKNPYPAIRIQVDTWEFILLNALVSVGSLFAFFAARGSLNAADSRSPSLTQSTQGGPSDN